MSCNYPKSVGHSQGFGSGCEDAAQWLERAAPSSTGLSGISLDSEINCLLAALQGRSELSLVKFALATHS